MEICWGWVLWKQKYKLRNKEGVAIQHYLITNHLDSSIVSLSFSNQLFFFVKYRRSGLFLVSFIELQLQDFMIYGTSLQKRELKFYQ